MANSVDPDETACYEPSHLDLHCFHRYLFWSAGQKGLNTEYKNTNQSESRMVDYKKELFLFPFE